jgi:hypothetical protein
MLGLARASEYAGWWSGGALVIADNTTTTTSLFGSLLTRPSYYTSWTGVTYPNSAGVSLVPSGSTTIDTTGIGTEAKRSLASLTFRVGQDWMTTAPTTDFYQGFFVAHSLQNDTVNTFRSVAVNKNNNQYLLTNGAGGDITIPAATFDADYRDRWLTYIVATSDTPTTTFAGWTGGATDPLGNGWGSRALLVDTITGDILGTRDAWNYSSAGTVDLTQTWTWGFDTSTYYDNHFLFFGGDIGQYNRADHNMISNWFAIGSTADPAVYYTQLTGTAISGTVAGIKSWSNWTFSEAGTVLNNGTVDYGYQNSIDGTVFGSRLPAGAVFDLIADPGAMTAQTIPQFVSI